MLRQASGPALTLATFGVLLTTGMFGAATFYMTEFNWMESFLLGAAVASTDAAAVFFLLRAGNINLRDRLRSTLEIESGTNDPIAIFLTIMLVGRAVGPDAGRRHICRSNSRSASSSIWGSAQSSALPAGLQSCA